MMAWLMLVRLLVHLEQIDILSALKAEAFASNFP